MCAQYVSIFLAAYWPFGGAHTVACQAAEEEEHEPVAVAAPGLKRPRAEEPTKLPKWLDELLDEPATLLDVRGATPAQALERLRAELPDDPVQRQAWRAQAKVSAVLGNCPKSRESLKSGGISHCICVRGPAIVFPH